MRIRVISVPGESHVHNEDFSSVRLDSGERRLRVAVGDWANNVEGSSYVDPETAAALGLPPDTRFNGGVIGSVVAKRVLEMSNETGYALIAAINAALAAKYADLGIVGVEARREKSFTGYIAHADITPERAIVTAVGDVRCAADGEVVAGATKEIDRVHNVLRAKYIGVTGDVEGAYAKRVRPALLRQYKYQNTPGSPYSYPAIDGTETLPVEAVKVLTIPTPSSLLLWSDGYVAPPNARHIEELEDQLRLVYEVDPGRYQRFPAIGTLKDDRTAVEVSLDDFQSSTIERVSPSA